MKMVDAPWRVKIRTITADDGSEWVLWIVDANVPDPDFPTQELARMRTEVVDAMGGKDYVIMIADVINRSLAQSVGLPTVGHGRIEGPQEAQG